VKFQGTIVNANSAQVTARAKGNDLSLQTFTLNPEVAAKMQKIVDNGGYQYGDKVTIYYDAASPLLPDHEFLPCWYRSVLFRFTLGQIGTH
jgi:hypothetical protein